MCPRPASMKSLVDTCLYYVGENASGFSADLIKDIPLSLLRQLLPYLSAYQLHRLDSVFKSAGVSVDAVWEAHLHKRWPQTYQQTVQIFHDSPRTDFRQQYLEKHFHELLRFSHFKQHLDPLGKMNASLYKLGLCVTSGFHHHPTMSASSLQQVLHHYSEHVARLSIMGLQCGLILQDDALVNVLKMNIHTVNLHHVQDKYYAQTRQLLLRLLERDSLQQVTLYNVWLSDINLRNLISICAGLPTRQPPEIQVEVPTEKLTYMPDFTVAHQEDFLHTSQNTKRKTVSPPPKCKRLKLLKNSLRKTNVDPLPPSSPESEDSKTNFSTYDFKCSKFCFKKCQCDIRLSQDFEPVAGASSDQDKKTKLSVPDTSQCQLVGSTDASVTNANNSQPLKCTHSDTAHEFDLFDEAVALSGPVPLSEIGIAVFSNQSPDNEKDWTGDRVKQSPESESIYEDLDDFDGGPSTSQGKGKVKCNKVHKHSANCDVDIGMLSNRGLEGLAIVSTGAMSLTSHLVDIMPHWNNLKKFAVIHTAVRSWELREVLLEKIRCGQLTHLIIEDTFLSSYILDFVAEAAAAERPNPMQLYRCSNNMQDLIHNLFELNDNMRFDGIVHLDLSYNSFEGTGLNLLCSIITNSSVLRKLELRRCQLREGSLKAVLRAIQENGRIESLNLAENVLWDSAESEMVITLNSVSSLHSLNISSCAFSLQLVGGDDFLNAIAHHPNLHKLYLSGNWIRDVGCKVLLRVCTARIERRCRGGIQSLNLGFSGMHAEGLLAVAEEIRRQADEENIQMPLLESLDLSGNPVALQQAQIRDAFNHLVRHLRVDTYSGDVPLSDHLAQM